MHPSVMLLTDLKDLVVWEVLRKPKVMTAAWEVHKKAKSNVPTEVKNVQEINILSQKNARFL